MALASLREAGSASADKPTSTRNALCYWDLERSARTEMKGETVALSAEQQSIKDEFIKVRHTWGPQWETILQLDPELCADTSIFPRCRGERTTWTIKPKNSCI